MTEIIVSEIERWLDRLYVAAEGAGLRDEDRRKAIEVTAMLVEIERAVRRFRSRSHLTLVDAAAGKSYVGLLAAKLLLEPMSRPASVVAIEREPRRAALSRQAAERLQTAISIECRTGSVADPDIWPERPSIVAALHACGQAADAIIERTISSQARMLLLVPCCTNSSIPSAAMADEQADHQGIPRHAPVRRRFIQALVDTERTWRLEAAGYETEVVEFVAATVTPHNLLWRSRLVKEPVRMAAARRALENIWGVRS
ncbi:MAG TPA: methyltransferase [Acidobacteriota bacterium]|nr:methyltransferase [Acidobacteriota bacterium]